MLNGNSSYINGPSDPDLAKKLMILLFSVPLWFDIHISCTWLCYTTIGTHKPYAVPYTVIIMWWP